MDYLLFSLSSEASSSGRYWDWPSWTDIPSQSGNPVLMFSEILRTEQIIYSGFLHNASPDFNSAGAHPIHFHFQR